MKKKVLLTSVVALMSTLLLTGCCNHEWQDATCGVPQTCTLCGATKGEPTGDHLWKDATCTEPKTCAVCGQTEGEALGHTWEDATCTEPKTCSVCGETEGNELGHKWKMATCTEPQTCSRCKKTVGDPLGHTVAKWEVTKEATCTEDGEESGKCSVCEETVTQKIDKIDHTPGEWVITKEAGLDEAGEKTQSCTACGEVLETEEYNLTSEEREAAFKALCQTYTYEQISRNPDTYNYKKAVYTGFVFQVIDNDKDDGSICYMVKITHRDKLGYTDPVCVKFTEDAVARMSCELMVGDVVTIWGYNYSTVTYTSVLGNENTIPAVRGEYVEVLYKCD